MKPLKKVWIIGGILAVIIALVVLYVTFKNTDKDITDFESCAEKYPVMETYPAQCRTKGGRNFTQQSAGEFKKAIINDKIEEKVETNYYDISGQTKEELNAQMTELGPECDDQECYAKTAWAIDWTYPAVKANTCEPVSVTVLIQYIFPRWVDKDQAPTSLQTDWDNFYRSLKKHEENHKEIVTRNANLFLAKIKEINSQNYVSCRELQDKISEFHATGEIINRTAQESEDYDLQTEHGATEGALLQ